MADRANDARVVQVLDSGFKVVVNKGADDGVKLGQSFLIYKLGPEMTDPETDAPLGVLEIVKGRGKVCHVQEKMATVESSERREANRTRAGTGLFAIVGPAEQFKIEELPFDRVERGDYARRV